MKNKNNDYSFIASKFEQEGVNAPDDLTLDSIISKSSNNKIIKFKGNKKGVKVILSLVACIAIIACSITSVNAYYDVKYKKSDEIVSFSSYAQINGLLTNLQGGILTPFLVEKASTAISFDYAASDFDGLAETVDDAEAVDVDISNKSFSTTNKQIDTVDEADVIKTDGKYIYYLSNYEITIYTADGKNSRLIGKINNYYSLYTEMYVMGDRLVAIAGNDVTRDNDKSIYSSTVYIYDITDRANPELKNKFSQSGSYTSSRVVGDYLYIVSSYYAYNKEMPVIAYDDGIPERVSYKDIFCMPHTKSPGFVVVSAIDLNNAKSNTKTKAIIGSNSDIYCTEKNLYLINDSYDYSRKSGRSNIYTHIVRVGLDGLKLDINGKGKVNGYIENQYSIDESNGYLRIATNDFDANNLYVLDDKLKQIGAVESFAQGEQIKAVRYIDNYAYVITYEQTDPLFIIDLSNPEKPEITGSAKITGFSDNLIPVDENTLLGVGYAENNAYMKLVAFDISNKNNPQIINSMIYKCTSEAQHNIKALLINKEAGYFGFAYEIPNVFNYDGSIAEREKGHNGGVITFKVEKNGVKETHHFKSDSAIFLNRCVYIDNEIYALTVGEEMLVFDTSK